MRAVVVQQLAGAAANAIHRRVRALVDGPLTPDALAAVPDEALCTAGLSANKLASLRDLSAKVMSGDVVLGASQRTTDDEIISGLRRCAASGAGPPGPRGTHACGALRRLGQPRQEDIVDLLRRRGVTADDVDQLRLALPRRT